MPAHDGALDRPTFFTMTTKKLLRKSSLPPTLRIFQSVLQNNRPNFDLNNPPDPTRLLLPSNSWNTKLNHPSKIFFLKWNVNNFNAYIFWNPSRIILVILSESLATVFNINHQIKLFVDDFMLLTRTWSCYKVFDIYDSLYFPTFS